jgi:hypothetical protein
MAILLSNAHGYHLPSQAPRYNAGVSNNGTIVRLLYHIHILSGVIGE